MRLQQKEAEKKSAYAEKLPRMRNVLGKPIKPIRRRERLPTLLPLRILTLVSQDTFELF